MQKFFLSRPFTLKVDGAKSLRSIVADLIEAAFARQRECPGTMITGAVMQHLVGAKLELALPDEVLEHHGFSVADSPSDRKGDFLIGAHKALNAINFWEGLMDELVIINKALSEAEIGELMNTGAMGILLVESPGKLATTWGKTKSN